MKVKVDVFEQRDKAIGFYEEKNVIEKKTGELEIFTLAYDEK